MTKSGNHSKYLKFHAHDVQRLANSFNLSLRMFPKSQAFSLSWRLLFKLATHKVESATRNGLNHAQCFLLKIATLM